LLSPRRHACLMPDAAAAFSYGYAISLLPLIA